MSRLGVCDLVKCHVSAGIIACRNDVAIFKKFKCEFALLQISACQLLIDLDLVGYAGWQFFNTVSIGKCELRAFLWIILMAVGLPFPSSFRVILKVFVLSVSLITHAAEPDSCHLVFQEVFRSGSICCRVHILQQIKGQM